MIELVTIGIAHTPFPSTRAIPRQGAGPASVEVFAPFVPALDGLLLCSHLWVFSFFDEADREILQAHPRKADPSAPARGVFAMRAPVRPNPIGLSCARILRIDGPIVHLDRLDVRDRTPIIDLKPYSPGWDLIPSARSAHRYDPSRYEHHELDEALRRDACNALGPDRAVGQVARELTDALARIVIDVKIDIREPSTLFVVGALDARVDILLCATGASFGNGRLQLCTLPDDTVVEVRSGEASWRVARVDASPSMRVTRM